MRFCKKGQDLPEKEKAESKVKGRRITKFTGWKHID